ncbi:uncharacterized protein LOC141591452 isoform X5 [Silene latifolia]|uniref:uncharacterized protein LOC141591452 isoform X5 n=1 Tax=Silene latifolia TaxID=37657 RepID=UPI003D782CA6
MQIGQKLGGNLARGGTPKSARYSGMPGLCVELSLAHHPGHCGIFGAGDPQQVMSTRMQQQQLNRPSMLMLSIVFRGMTLLMEGGNGVGDATDYGNVEDVTRLRRWCEMQGIMLLVIMSRQ